MRQFFPRLLLVVALSGGVCPGWAAEPGQKLDLTTRIQLNAALQIHIDRIASRGGYPHLDLKSGQLQTLRPALDPPVILRMGEQFVMSTDFRDDTGRAVAVDFYLTPKDKGFSVFQIEFANRAPLEALIKAGAVRATE